MCDSKEHLLQFYKIYTVNDMKWNGIKNGELLKLISQYNFDCWIVVDKNIPYQQNISQLPCLIIVLNVFRNTLMNLISFIPQILQTLQLNKSNTLVILEEQ